jgi:hypothetical protein
VGQHNGTSHVCTRVIQGTSHLGQRCARGHQVIDKNDGYARHTRPHGHALEHVVRARHESELRLISATSRGNEWLPQRDPRVTRDEFKRFEASRLAIGARGRWRDEPRARHRARTHGSSGDEFDVVTDFKCAQGVNQPRCKSAREFCAAAIFDGMQYPSERFTIITARHHGTKTRCRHVLSRNNLRLRAKLLRAGCAQRNVGDTASGALARKHENSRLAQHVAQTIPKLHALRVA